MALKPRILVAPLNWGLGHATRCVPVINALLANGYDPILASDGTALELLKKEFPSLHYAEFASYNIRYPKHGDMFRLQMIKNAPAILHAISKEQKQTAALISEYDIKGIISDNRLGVRHEAVPSVIITHQLKVLSGQTTWLSSKMHNAYIKKFDECWVPDIDSEKNLSGELGHPEQFVIPTKHIGLLSRLNNTRQARKYDLIAIISGPEPQRTEMENKLTMELKTYPGSVLMVCGRIEEKQTSSQEGQILKVNFMLGQELETAINSSSLVLSRSGYSTIMDLAKLGNKAFFIPTPGQFEQEYLAKRLDHLGIVPFCKQSDFNMEQLLRAEKYSGFKSEMVPVNYKALFGLFKSE
ncbi:MAG: glycosyltransferase [Flavobacteriaceae bacterium]|nr:glycosyltransferase [Flavobacteriaceae bacterium]